MRGDVIDDDPLTACADLIADGGLEFELAAGFQAKLNVVVHTTGDPAIRRDASNRGEAHARRPANDFENSRHDLDPRDCRNVGRDTVHGPSSRVFP